MGVVSNKMRAWVCLHMGNIFIYSRFSLIPHKLYPCHNLYPSLSFITLLLSSIPHLSPLCLSLHLALSLEYAGSHHLQNRIIARKSRCSYQSSHYTVFTKGLCLHLLYRLTIIHRWRVWKKFHNNAFNFNLSSTFNPTLLNQRGPPPYGVETLHPHQGRVCRDQTGTHTHVCLWAGKHFFLTYGPGEIWSSFQSSDI